MRGKEMLSEEERREIKEKLEGHGNKRAASLEALEILQRRRGWVSGEIREIAGLLEMTPDELDSIATFYSLIYRKPVGRHVVLVCDSVSCWITGYETVRDHISSKLGVGLGETTPDGMFTLLPVSCLGACDHGPAMMIDAELYGDLEPAKIDEILEKYR
jgi:NADH-quinone oxidoreductase subunit E